MKKSKKILVILGHPRLDSLNHALAESYAKGAEKNFEVRKLYLTNLKFDPVLHNGYKKIQKLEPDLVKAQKDIEWADHLVFFYPIWWTAAPALLKGFIDRVFLPGWAFKYNYGGEHETLLNNKTGSMIMTTGGSKWWYIFFGIIMNKPIAIGFLKFCGIKPKKQRFISEIRKDTNKERIQKIISKVEIWGEKGI